MTDTEKFREIIKESNIPFYQVAKLLDITPQSLYNKAGNATEFTQGELIKIREIFPKMTDKQFKEIFLKGWAVEKALTTPNKKSRNTVH